MTKRKACNNEQKPRASNKHELAWFITHFIITNYVCMSRFSLSSYKLTHCSLLSFLLLWDFSHVDKRTSLLGFNYCGKNFRQISSVWKKVLHAIFKREYLFLAVCVRWSPKERGGDVFTRAKIWYSFFAPLSHFFWGHHHIFYLAFGTLSLPFKFIVHL